MSLKSMFNSKKLYFKMFFSFSILSILVVLSISILISSMYMKSVTKQLQENYSSSLDRLSNDFDNIFSGLNQMNINLRQYPDISTFLLSGASDYATSQRANSLLSSITIINPYLHSTIMYNKSYNYTLSSGGSGIAIEQFTNFRLNRPDAKSIFNIVNTGIAQNSTIGAKQLNTLSIIYTDSETFEGSIDSAIIMTLDVEVIEKNVLGKYDGVTIISDNSGKIIFSNLNSPGENSIKGEAYFKRILSSPNTRESFKQKIGKETKLITSTKNISTDFYIINIKSYQGITNLVNEKVYNIALMCLVVIVIYCLAAYILSRRIYSPIGKAATLFSKFNKTESDGESDEITLISRVFSETLNELQQLEHANMNNNYRLKEEYLKHILKTDVIYEDIKQEIQGCKLNIAFENLIILSLRIDNYSQLDTRSRHAYETTLCKTIPEIVSTSFQCEVVNLYEGELAILLNYKENHQGSMNILLSETEKIITTASKTLQITTTIGIGGTAENISECKTLYNKAIEMVKHRFVLGMGKVIYDKFITENLSSEVSFSKDEVTRLINAIKLNKKQNYVKSVESIIDIIKKATYSRAVSLLFEIMTVCIQTINESIKQDESSYSLNFDEFNQLFTRLQTIDNAKEWLLGIFDEYQRIHEEISALRNNKHNDLVKKIQDYIKENYNDNNLCMDTISELTGYAPYYFSKIFKEVTGININDYIRETRVSKAKELLETTDIKVNDICTMTGFSNTSNFYLVFKKDVGLAPAAYRQLKVSN